MLFQQITIAFQLLAKMILPHSMAAEKDPKFHVIRRSLRLFILALIRVNGSSHPFPQ